MESENPKGSLRSPAGLGMLFFRMEQTMTVRFHVLASGSSGNACVLDVDGFGILLDFGLTAKQLAARMQRCRLTWEQIHAVVLTHPHTDHWQAATLNHIAKLKLPFHCHADHISTLSAECPSVAEMDVAGRLRRYSPGEWFALSPHCRCLPIALRHDGAATCGFRFEGMGAILGAEWAMGYAADLGSWQPDLAKSLADVELLALEFNHDVNMQIRSGRGPHLIRRVLGDDGHLSNEQAAGLLAEVIRTSTPGRLRDVVQLHLSEQCNDPELAHAAARKTCDELGLDATIHTTRRGKPGASIVLGQAGAKPRSRKRPKQSEPACIQPLLPFGE